MKKILFWVIAFLITVSTIFYQRLTGPTHPVSGKITVNESEIAYKFERGHVSTRDYKIKIEVPDSQISGYLTYKRYKTSDSWTNIPLVRKEDSLVASLPKQPPAGKMEYRVILSFQEKEISLTAEESVIIRFRGSVPAVVLIAHIIIIFLGMLFSTRAGIEALDRKGNPRKLVLWTLGLLFVGGLILGPVVQKYAFGAFWTGFPLGKDLTDTKILVAMVVWIVAAIAGRGGKPARRWVLGASILLLIVFLIPHSLLGSELDYSKMDASSTIQKEIVTLPLK
jgi:hypothetical protein